MHESISRYSCAGDLFRESWGYGGITMHENFSSQKWIERVQANCESLGISKLVIDRFIKFYMPEGRENDAKSTTTATKLASTSG